jgi:protein-tyrosine-phosphatase
MGDSQFQLSRRSVGLALVLFARPAGAAIRPCPAPRVLFVCPAGTVKSAIAREMLKRGALGRGIAVQVRSRGVHPEDHLSPELAGRLAADGLDPKAEPVRAYSPPDAADADVVIVFDEAAQAPGLEGARAWDVPSFNGDYAHAMPALERRTSALLDELAARACPSG